MEQYFTRQCLGNEGILKPHKEKAEDVINLVKECFAEVDVDIPDTVLDRAHRIGPVYKDESDQELLNWITLDLDQCSAKLGKTKTRKTCLNRPNKQLL